MSKLIGWGLVVVAVLWTIGGTILWIQAGYRYGREIDAYINRAQIAADREDMIRYLELAQDGLEKHDATEGHTKLIFKKPDNDLALMNETINRILERLDSIAEIPKSDTAYQVALDDLRGTIREIWNPGSGLTWVRYGWWLLTTILLSWIAGFIGGVVAYESSY